VISPTSIAIALAMLEPGANDQGLSELRSLLHIADPKAFHDSMAALQQSLESRKASEQNDKPEGDVEMHVANAAFVQDGYPVQPAYVDAITRSYGPTVQRVDYASHTKQAIDDINAFVAKQTKDRIKTIVTDNDVDSDTVLALVNALYMKASWLTPFHKDETRSDTFHKRDSSTTTIQLMHGHSDASLRGDGWVAGTKQYIGNLAVQFVLPDEGHFDDVAGRIGTVFGAITYPPDSDADLAVPRFTTQQRAPLDDALKQRGLNAVFGTGYLLPIAHDPRLFVKTVAHATFLAMDEQGTEAAASTAVVANATSAPATPPERVPVILTRPFFFRILDTESGATLFVGRIMEPKEAS
jgi:serpin B